MSDAHEAEVERELFLRSLSSNGILASVAKRLAVVMEEAPFAAGDVIYPAGGRPTLLYFLVTGDVELRREGAQPWTFKAPYLIGVMDAIHRRPHARTARAITPIRAMTLRASIWFETLEDHFEAFQSLVHGVSGDLHRLQLDLAPGGGFAEPAAALGARGSLDVLERTLALRAVPSFAGATVQALAELALAADEIALAPGDPLFAEGGPADSVFAVASGIVRTERRDPAMLARFGAGSLVGGAVAIGLDVDAYTATAETAAVVLAIRREHLFDVIEDHPETIRTVLSGLMSEQERLNDARAEIADLESTQRRSDAKAQ